ncbi:MAG: hypothetical protein V4527_14630 [Pseudomonadota bacterium]
MNYYFLPRHPVFETAVTLANFSPVDAVGRERQHIYLAWTDGTRWIIEAMGDLGAGESRNFTSKNLPQTVPADRACFFFFFPKLLPATLNKLPTDPMMETAPAWRGNIQFRSPTTRTSYQGEYPSAMLKLKKQSLVSISPMIQGGDDIGMHFLLANLCETPEQHPRTLKFAAARDRKVVLEATVYTNAVSLVDISAIAPLRNELFCTVSSDITGVPLYLAFDVGGTQLSLEHTHPPTELFAFSRQPQVPVKRMKSWWLQQVKS